MVKVRFFTNVSVFVLGYFLTLIAGFEYPSDEVKLPCCHGVSVLRPGPSGGKVHGELEFFQYEKNGEVTITGEIRGFQPNTKHGFHVHESGDLRNKTNPCLSAGVHFNPLNKRHGGPQDDINHRHVGDLGNIVANSRGFAKVNIKDRIISMQGEFSIVGRTIMVHAMEDDLGKGGGDSMSSGNAGSRVACGVIGVIYQKRS